MYVRKINEIEKHVMKRNLNVFVSFEAKNPINVDHVKEAVGKCRQKYPYLSMKIVKNEQGDLAFYQQASSELENIPVKWEVINNSDEFADWTTRFNRFGSINFDLSVNVFNLEIHSHSTNKYQLCLSINHAACDGRGVFVVSRDLLYYMNCVVDKIEHGPIESKKFLEVQRDFKHTYDVDQLKQEPIPVDKNQILFSELKYPETKQDPIRTSFIGHFRQMNEQDSKRLLQICKEHKVTVQAVLSAANMICFLNEIDPQHLKDNKQIECINTIPCEMRYYFGLNEEDLIQSAAALCWWQKISGEQMFWTFSQESTNMIQVRKNYNEGLRWWTRLNNSLDMPKVYLTASSIGVVSMNEHMLSGFKINDVKFYMSSPTIAYNPNFLQSTSQGFIHAYTINDRFNLVLTFAHPSFSREWAKHYLDNILHVLQQLLLNHSQLTIGHIVACLNNFSNK